MFVCRPIYTKNYILNERIIKSNIISVCSSVNIVPP